jgi:hypothetical protein
MQLLEGISGVLCPKVVANGSDDIWAGEKEFPPVHVPSHALFTALRKSE